MSSSLDIDDVYERFAEVIARLIPFDLIVVALVEPGSDNVTIAHIAGADVPGMTPGTVRKWDQTVYEVPAFKAGGVITSATEAVRIAKEKGEINPLVGKGMQSFIDVPFLSQGKLIGSITVSSRQADAYQDGHLALFQRIGAQVAGAVANAKLHATVAKEAFEREVLAEIDRIVSASLNIEDAYEPMAVAFAKLVPFDRFNVVRVDKAAGTITNEFVTGSVDVPEFPVGATTNVDDGILVRVQMEGSAGVVMNDAEMRGLEDTWVNLRTIRKAGLLSIVSVPFKLGDEIVGLVAFRSCDPEAYGSEHLRLAQLMAGQVAGYFSNSLTYRQRTEVPRTVRRRAYRLLRNGPGKQNHGSKPDPARDARLPPGRTGRSARLGLREGVGRLTANVQEMVCHSGHGLDRHRAHVSASRWPADLCHRRGEANTCLRWPDIGPARNGAGRHRA